MVANDDSESVPSDDSDALDEVALASVNQALEAVENEEVVNEAPDEEEPPQPPRNVIPELEDVDDPEEMVQVLLTVGEERSRRGDVKGSLAAFNKAIALDPSWRTLMIRCRRTRRKRLSTRMCWTKWRARHRCCPAPRSRARAK